MALNIEFDPRPDYGRTTPYLKRESKLGWRISVGTNLLNLRSDINLTANGNGGLRAELKLKRGDTSTFSLTLSEEGPAVLPPLEIWSSTNWSSLLNGGELGPRNATITVRTSGKSLEARWCLNFFPTHHRERSSQRRQLLCPNASVAI